MSCRFSNDRCSSGGFRFLFELSFRRFDFAFDFVLPTPFHDLLRSDSSLAASLSSVLVVHALGFVHSAFAFSSFPSCFFFVLFCFSGFVAFPGIPSRWH